jgi:hypothetical protein
MGEGTGSYLPPGIPPGKSTKEKKQKPGEKFLYVLTLLSHTLYNVHAGQGFLLRAIDL